MYWLKPIPTPEPPPAPSTAKVRLQGEHLWLAAEVADAAFSDERQVYAVYYPNLKTLLLAPISDSMFKQAHEVSMLFVKIRNQQGDRTISMQEIILDHDLDRSDRDLEYTLVPGLGILQVKI